MIDKVVAICRNKLEGSVKSFETEISPSLPLVYTDPYAVEQILINLLVNALQAADKEDSWIRLSAFVGDGPQDYLRLEVSDNGCGMGPEVIKRIFDPFFTTKSPSLGTGLGLYVCQSLVKGLGGRIEVRSEAGNGSLFRVVLPERRETSGVGS